MRNFTKKITAAVLILFLALVHLFCCCLTGTAQAGTRYKVEQGKIDGRQCCPDKTKNADSDKTQECKCEKAAEISAIKGFNLSKVMDYPGQFSDRAISFSGQTNISDCGFAPNYSPRASTQIVKSDPPIYLQDSVLRL